MLEAVRRPRLSRRHSTVASSLALVLATTGLVFYAINAEGQRVLRADLHDGGIWVTKNDESLVGRQNKPLSQLDRSVTATSTADVLQQGSAVIAADISSFTLTPISPSAGRALEDDQVATAGPAVMGGGTVAVSKTDTGELWATHVDPLTGVTSLAELDQEVKPLAKVGANATLTATSSGDVIAATPGADEVTVVSPTEAGFAEPTKRGLDTAVSGEVTSVSAVGDVPAVLDQTNTVILLSASASLGPADEPIALQQPGPGSDRLLVATTETLSTVGIEDGSVKVLVDGSDGLEAGLPGAPVRLGACDWGVWLAGRNATVAMACDGQDVQVSDTFAVEAGANLVFRVNRNDLLLNDTTNGGVWNVDGANPTEITDWESLQDDQKPDDSNPNDSEAPEIKQEPDARDDDLGARPGFTTVLNVLDNDLVSGGGVLAITGTEGAEDEAGVVVRPAPDRQSILVTLPPTAARDVVFEYTVDDGTGGDKSQDTAKVVVRTRPTGEPVAPQRPENWDEDKQPVFPVTGGGQLELSVLPDWRDPEFGDRVTLDDVPEQKGLETTITPEGLLRVKVSRKGAPKQVSYQVSTGGPPIAGTVQLNVLSPDSLKPVSPEARPDVGAGQVGAPIKVNPLQNDIPGADPTDPQATLALAGQVQPRQGLKVRTDLETGEVTVTARKAGTYSLTYAAAFGAAKRDQGEIRIVVDPPTDGADAPIATPDVTTVRGTAPVIVDVLANDYDPQGRLLAVQSAAPVDKDSALEVAVLDGRWLRISATTTALTPNPQAVTYQLSNGAAPAQGTVSVTQKAPLDSEKNGPITGDDDVTVRVGDSAVVPVLANDTTPSGDPLGLQVPSTTDVLGELSVVPPVGKAYVVGNKVRYVAPASVDGPQTVEVQYVAVNTADRNAPPAAGALHVRLNPEPSETNPNGPPTPRSIEARVVAGDTINLRLPLVGNDPDGDTVSIVGISKAPVHGRFLAIGATSMSYQSFPGAPGFDEFSYVVTDRYGAQAEGDIRVVVTDAGSPQAPVAVADVVYAAPSRQIELDVLANDLRAPGTRISILGLENEPDGVELDDETDLIRLTSSDDPRTSLSFSYRITNGLDESVGAVTVKSFKDFNNPPVVRDAFAKPEGDTATVTVDVLKTAFDIDSQGEPLVVDPIDVEGAQVDGGRVTLPVLGLPQVVPFRVVDGDGAATAAVIYVPARPKDFPYLKPDAIIEVPVGKSVEKALGDLVTDPEGDPVVLTVVDEIVAGPAQFLKASALKKDVVKVTAGEMPGPGVVTFQVSDRAKLSDPDAHVVTLSVPVQIGNGAPILTCPNDTLPVIEGGPERTYDVASLCHVWTPTPSEAAGLTFTSAWAEGQQAADVVLTSDDRGFRLKAGVEARGETGVVNVGTAESEEPGQLLVEVLPAGPPSLSPIELDTKAEEPVSVDVAAYASSPFGSEAKYAVTDVLVVEGDAPLPTQDGTELTFTPPDFGTFVYQVTIADDGGAEGSLRPTATALVTLSVVDAPEAPTGVSWNGEKQDGQVRLSWTPPSSNGGAISYYTVYYTGPENDQQKCPAPNCTITGLENGEYSFKVTATNEFGESEESRPAATGIADTTPGQVNNLRVTLQRDHAVTLEWDPPTGEGDAYSEIENYYISWPDGGTKELPAGTSKFIAAVKDNGEPVNFKVWAANGAGMQVPSSERAVIPGMGAGRPEPPAFNTPVTSNRPGNDSKSVTLSWGPVAANGPPTVEYQVLKSGTSTPICAWSAKTTCSDDLVNDGSTTSYRVQARNGEGADGNTRENNKQLHWSSLSAATMVEAAATPDEADITEFVATGNDGQAKVTFDVGESHGQTNTIQCEPNCGTLGSTTVSNSGQSGLTATIGGYGNGQNATFRVRTCNGSSENEQTGPACSAWVSETTTPYGPIPNPTLNVSGSGQCLNWSFSGNANGKPVRYVLTMNGATISNGTSGNGSYNDGGQQCPGYSQTRNFQLVISDTAPAPGQTGPRQSRTVSRDATSEPEPAVVTVRKGNSCAVQTCSTGGTGYVACGDATRCWHVLTRTQGFPGGVTCEREIQGEGVLLPRWGQGGNEETQSAGHWNGTSFTFRVTCNGVSSAWTDW